MSSSILRSSRAIIASSTRRSLSTSSTLRATSSSSSTSSSASSKSKEKPFRQLSFETKSGQSHFKTFLPVTPSLRQLRQPVSHHLHKGDPVRALTVAKRSTGGRNDQGRITIRARGGGHKRRIRLVDFHRREPGEQLVERIEYDPGRSAHIALLKHKETQALSYILAPEGLREGDTVQSFRAGIPDSFITGNLEMEDAQAQSKETIQAVEDTKLSDLISGLSDPATPQSVTPPTPSSLLPGQTSFTPSAPASNSSSTPSSRTSSKPQKATSDQIDLGVLRSIAIRPGNFLPLRLIPIGTLIHGITLSPAGPAILARSAGSSARIISNSSPNGKHAQVRLGSGEVRLVNLECCASIGTVSNPDHQHRNLGKAGRMRWLGFRPQSRGVAMNAKDHPHGGGRGKSKGNNDPVDPWGNSAKGARTRPPSSKNGNKFVVKERPRGTEKNLRGR
ncbi:ribosomal protein L2 [Meredithblackwellia eburnea MCA 4105]